LKNIIPVILSGGLGTGLWPLSRKNLPKQYLRLISENSMLQETIIRLNNLDNLRSPLIICNEEHRFLVKEQCKKINIEDSIILLEQTGRNTAPAIAAAAIQSLKDYDDALLLVLTADHVIKDKLEFHNSINIAIQYAQEDKLVTFGVVPTEPNTRYGYIRFYKDDKNSAHNVEKFVEKPNLNSAKSFLKEGNYLWNSGMFLFKARTLIDEMTTHSPNIVKSVKKAIDKAVKDQNFIWLDDQEFASSPFDSIDYALMEKSQNVVVVPLEAGWNDVGSWAALDNIAKKDKSGNVIKGDVITEETTNTYINASHHIIATIGLNDLVIVDTPNATLISSKDKTHKVKKIVQRLQEQNRKEQSTHRKVYRPWGWFDIIEEGKYFKVKRLHVNAGAKLSLQMHTKRSEHWVVISGVAKVIKGEKGFDLLEGDSTYISVGEKHSLENKGPNALEIIEVQSGSYLGEDDIVRFEDIYGRA
jgi:mannose-1-phosphate guanylyltransferase/mannose-6-phosphate isomerase